MIFMCLCKQSTVSGDAFVAFIAGNGLNYFIFLIYLGKTIFTNQKFIYEKKTHTLSLAKNKCSPDAQKNFYLKLCLVAKYHFEVQKHHFNAFITKLKWCKLNEY